MFIVNLTKLFISFIQTFYLTTCILGFHYFVNFLLIQAYAFLFQNSFTFPTKYYETSSLDIRFIKDVYNDTLTLSFVFAFAVLRPTNKPQDILFVVRWNHKFYAIIEKYLKNCNKTHVKFISNLIKWRY